MAVIDRLKLRIETDLTDAELQLIIDAEAAEISDRFGAIASITTNESGHRKYLVVNRPIDTAQGIAIVEISPPNTGAAANRTTLAADDYRITDGGRTIERLIDGTNGQTVWSELVEITYTPISNQAQRDEVTIKLAMMSITFQGLVKQTSIGDHTSGGSVTPDAYQREREALMQSLTPRGRMVMA